MDKVYLCIDINNRGIFGCFETREQAERFTNKSSQIAIQEIEVIVSPKPQPPLTEIKFPSLTDFTNLFLDIQMMNGNTQSTIDEFYQQLKSRIDNSKK